MATPEPEDPAHQGGPISPAVASPEAIKEEFITQRMRTWLTKEQCILPHHDGLAKFYAMRTDTSKATPEALDVLAISCKKGYRFISLDDGPNTDPQLKERIETLGKWCANPANKHILVEIEALLVQEVQDKVWWLPEEEEDTILKLGILERVKQYARLCAKTRLMDLATVDTPETTKSAPIHQCKFCICSVDKQGAVSVAWKYLPWSASLRDFIHRVNDTPSFEFEDALPRLLKRLDFLDGLEKVADQVETIKKSLEVEPSPESKTTWACSLCDKETLNVATRTWTPIASEDDFAKILEVAKRDEKLLLFMRPWQDRLYRICREIQQLENDPFPSSDDEWDPFVLDQYCVAEDED